MTLTVRLSGDDEHRLQQLVEALNAHSQSDLIRQMIVEKWNDMQANRTWVERRGGHPVHLLDGSSTSSLRENRKAALAVHFDAKAAARKRVFDENTD